MMRVTCVPACVIEYRGNCVVTAVLQLLFILFPVISRIPRAFSLTILRIVFKSYESPRSRESVHLFIIIGASLAVVCA
jgi:hypothetical protein